MKKLKIYLAGTFSNWREKVIKELHDSFEFYHPLIHSRQGSMIEYVSDDLKAVAKCDIILAYQDKSFFAC
jgi:nucleoside 2-deoxyribosyltransferase